MASDDLNILVTDKGLTWRTKAVFSLNTWKNKIIKRCWLGLFKVMWHCSFLLGHGSCHTPEFIFLVSLFFLTWPRTTCWGCSLGHPPNTFFFFSKKDAWALGTDVEVIWLAEKWSSDSGVGAPCSVSLGDPACSHRYLLPSHTLSIAKRSHSAAAVSLSAQIICYRRTIFSLILVPSPQSD